MQTRYAPLSGLFALLLHACGDTAPAFLPLDQLCEAVSEDVCDAPSSCCGTVEDEAACLARVRAECEAQRAELVKEDALTYDGVEAAKQQRALQVAIAACEPPTAIASFFRGGRPLGSACERGAQCQSGACSTTCVAGKGPSLCPAALAEYGARP